MTINFKTLYKKDFLNSLVSFFDIILFALVTSLFFYDFYLLISIFIDHYINFNTINDVITYMSSNSSSHNTNVGITRDVYQAPTTDHRPPSTVHRPPTTVHTHARMHARTHARTASQRTHPFGARRSALGG
jgi:hypothetical protein